jgi:hypothetical protein
MGWIYTMAPGRGETRNGMQMRDLFAGFHYVLPDGITSLLGGGANWYRVTEPFLCCVSHLDTLNVV